MSGSDSMGLGDLAGSESIPGLGNLYQFWHAHLLGYDIDGGGLYSVPSLD